MDIEQATTSTPLSIADLISSSRELTFLFFITILIILSPMPSMCMLESLSFLLPLGIIKPNIESITPFFTSTFPGLLSILSPQKVKNSVTFLPIEAAPLAIIKAAIALSKSPLKTTMVLLSFAITSDATNLFTLFNVLFFLIKAQIMPLSLVRLTNSLFVLSHQDLISS